MADLLIYALHGRALRALAAGLGTHIQGIQQGARTARQKGRISSRMCKKLLALGAAFGLLRHATAPGHEAFFDALVSEMNSEHPAPKVHDDTGTRGELDKGQQGEKVVTPVEAFCEDVLMDHTEQTQEQPPSAQQKQQTQQYDNEAAGCALVPFLGGRHGP